MRYVKDRVVLKRKRVYEALRSILNYPLVVVAASAGFGKTYAIQAFMKEQQRLHRPTQFVTIASNHEHPIMDDLWNSVIRNIASVLPDVSSELLSMRFPQNLPQRKTCTDLIRAMLKDRVLVLIFDDYQMVESPELNQFIEHLVTSQIGNLHLVLLSRTIPRLPIDSFELSGNCLLFTSRDLTLSIDEIVSYFALMDIKIDQETAEILYRESEGWFAAIHFALIHYLETGRVGFDIRIQRFLENTEMSRYSDEQIWLLSLLSHVGSFNASLASHISGQRVTGNMLQRLEYGNSFIQVDHESGMYFMHRMFRKLLQNHYDTIKREASSRSHVMLSRSDIYRRASSWYFNHDLPVEGFSVLLKAEDFNAIITQFSTLSHASVVEQNPEFFQELLHAVPLDVKQSSIHAWVSYIGFHVTNIDISAAEDLVRQVRGVLEQQGFIDSQQRQQIEGELCLIESYAQFNDCNRMFERMKAAWILLEGSSSVAHKDKVITFGSPHALFLYYREKGGLLETVHSVNRLYQLYHKLSGGCGSGFDDLLYAEYYLETGDSEKCEVSALRAFHRADLHDQHEVTLCAQFCLGRLRVVQGNLLEVHRILKTCRSIARRTDNPIIIGAADLIIAYLSCILHEETDIATWICTGSVQSIPVLYHAHGFAYLVCGKYLLMKREYVRLEAFCEEIRRVCNRFDNRLGLLHAYLLEASAQLRLRQDVAAQRSVRAALELGVADSLVTPFTEYCSDLLDLLISVNDKITADLMKRPVSHAEVFLAYLDRVISAMTCCSSVIERMQSEVETLTRISPRELEVLKLLTEGKSNQEIADGLYVAEVTVRKHLTALYRKLSVSGRTEAVRKAVLIGLV